MRRYLDLLFKLDDDRSIWVEENELGTEKIITHRNKRYSVRIPQEINKKVTLRLRGLGKTKGTRTGDLLIHVRLNKGDDIRRDLWLSETSARNGVKKILLLDDKKIQIVIPRNSYQGLVIRLKGLGGRPDFNWLSPFLRRQKGHLLVKLSVYPD